MNDFISLLLTSWALCAALMVALWLVQVKTKNASFVDMGWTLSIAISAIVYALNAQGLGVRKLLIALMVTIWAGRLVFLLILRLMRDPSEDARYRRIREDWKTAVNFKFFLMFQFQALLAVVLSWPFLLIASNTKVSLTALEIIGMMIWVVGLVLETVADEQLRKFKMDPTKKGKTCDVGLWRYSRHPNYFFEWAMWVGYFIVALNVSLGWTAVLSPLLMLYFLLKVSGIPLAEAQSLKTKGEDYRRYQASTSMFIPLPKRKI